MGGVVDRVASLMRRLDYQSRTWAGATGCQRKAVRRNAVVDVLQEAVVVIAAHRRNPMKAGFRLNSQRRSRLRGMFDWAPVFAGATGSEPWRQNQPNVMPAQARIQSTSTLAHYPLRTTADFLPVIFINHRDIPFS